MENTRAIQVENLQKPQDPAHAPQPGAGEAPHPSYRPDSAAALMSVRFITIDVTDTVSAALDRIQSSRSLHREPVHYVYVVDKERHLLGVVAIRDLVFNAPSHPVADIMKTPVHYVYADDDRELVLRRIEEENLLAIPVVDHQKRLVGIVPLQQVLHVAEVEAGEDMHLMVGLPSEERLDTPWTTSIRNRLPWLCINMGTAMLAAVVVGFFEGTIQAWSALVVFLPLISAVAGNAGIQGLTVVIRGIALGEFNRRDAIRTLRKEVTIGVVNGFVLGMVIGLIAVGWKGSVLLGVVAGAAMLLNQVLGALLGVLVPLALRMCKVDPALASSIFVTTFTDMAGFLVFLGFAKLALSLFS